MVITVVNFLFSEAMISSTNLLPMCLSRYAHETKRRKE